MQETGTAGVKRKEAELREAELREAELLAGAAVVTSK